MSDTSIKQKLKADDAYIQKEVPGYQFASLYKGNMSDTELTKALDEPVLDSVRTVVE